MGKLEKKGSLDSFFDDETLIFTNQSDDISDSDKKSAQIIIDRNEKRLKPKVIKINVDEAVLEGNLIEMPFISYSKSNKKDFVSLCEYTWIDSKNSKRGIEVRGSAKFGVPTSFDFDVLVALLRVFVRRNEIKYGIGVYDADPDKSVTIEFTFTEIAKELGYKKPNSKILTRIQNSIQTLTDTTIYNKYNGGIYDITKEEYIYDENVAFHIIEYFKSYNYKNDKNNTRLASSDITQTVVLNKFFYRSMTNNYFKFFNYYMYTQLQSGIAKKIYLLVNKWRAKGEKTKKIKLSTLYDRIPLEPELAVRVKNQSIKKALENLKDINYIKDFNIVRKDQTVLFIFEDEDFKFKIPNNLKNEYPTFSEFKKRMVDIGFKTEFFDDNIDKIVENYKQAKEFLIELEIKSFDSINLKNSMEKFFENLE